MLTLRSSHGRDHSSPSTPPRGWTMLIICTVCRALVCTQIFGQCFSRCAASHSSARRRNSSGAERTTAGSCASKASAQSVVR
eukprot:5611998-Prymnesium_polylepis.2